jgi:MFS family permease
LSAVGERARFGEVFAVREFQALWLAYLLSVAGDQLALVALSVLVFHRTHSPLLTAATYAVSFVPWLLGGLALARLADRLPRRLVMITCDLARAALVAIMALPGMPLWLLIVLLFVVTLLDSPFRAARSAIIPDILTGDRYVVGTAAMQTTNQAGRVLGFAIGGAVVAVLGVRPALAIDAATFAASALLVWLGVHSRAAPARAAPATQGDGQAGSALRFVFTDPYLRTVMLLGWLVMFYAVPEALAVPYAARLHGGAQAAGLVLAAGPFGAIIGSVVFSRLVPPQQRLRWMGLLAVGCCAALGLCLLRPGLAASLVIFTASMTMSAYQLSANAAFVIAVPAHRRGEAFGLANTGIRVGQGAWFLVAGAAAGVAAPATVIAASGILGAAWAAVLALSWRRHTTAPASTSQ